jgi:hypothetical protein
MTRERKLYTLLSAIIFTGIAAAVIAVPRVNEYRTITVRGAVVRQSPDANKRTPVAGVKISAASDGAVLASTTTDASGAFRIVIRRALIIRHTVGLSFSHPDYKPYEVFDPSADKLYVAAMQPLRDTAPPPPTNQPNIRITNVSVRYTLKTPGIAEVGSGAKTFQVDSKSNVICDGHLPCSPDGKWKAWVGGAALDAGPDNDFRNGRVSCIAGPCPFTKIDHDNFTHEARKIDVSVIGWSDTTTFLLQAEAIRHILVDSTQRAYPLIFDHTMSFSLPTTADGICVEAEVAGQPITFPINPNFNLSWANCEIQPEPENNRLYRCDLKPGYVFF